MNSIAKIGIGKNLDQLGFRQQSDMHRIPAGIIRRNRHGKSGNKTGGFLSTFGINLPQKVMLLAVKTAVNIAVAIPGQGRKKI